MLNVENGLSSHFFQGFVCRDREMPQQMRLSMSRTPSTQAAIQMAFSFGRGAGDSNISIVSVFTQWKYSTSIPPSSARKSTPFRALGFNPSAWAEAVN
jgi:hypothetical protein